MSWQASHQPCCSHVPQEHRFVVGPGYKHIAFGREGYAEDIVMMADQRQVKTLPCSDIPKADDLVV